MAKPAGDGVIRAGGGVVWRDGEHGLEIVVVHRPAYDDWSLPKGKCNSGESEEDCAGREVEEETGLRCELGVELPQSRYVDRHGRRKMVRYWSMRPLAGELTPNDEVDQALWMVLPDARAALSYERDKDVLDAFAAMSATPRES